MGHDYKREAEDNKRQVEEDVSCGFLSADKLPTSARSALSVELESDLYAVRNCNVVDGKRDNSPGTGEIHRNCLLVYFKESRILHCFLIVKSASAGRLATLFCDVSNCNS